MDAPSIAEVMWPGGSRFWIPPALYMIPFPSAWDAAETDHLLIEAIVRGGKGTFGGTPHRDPSGRGRIRGYSHSLIILADRRTGACAESFAPVYVRGPRSFGGEEVIEALAETMPPLVVEGIEMMRGLFKLRHPAILKQVNSRMHGQGHFRPKIFCVNRLDARAYYDVLRMVEALHSPPAADRGRAMQGGARHYQIAGFAGWNCDRFRRAARQAAGLPTSVMGRICPWPAFRAAAICCAARLSDRGLPASPAHARYGLLRKIADFCPETRIGMIAADHMAMMDDPGQKTRHYGPDTTRAMYRRAIRLGFIRRPHRATYLGISDPAPAPIMSAPRSSARQSMTRRALLGLSPA